ncbi:3-hydroxyisobutyrate dehydrogenase [Pseudarthrobacter sp. AG30]|uniref:3-hydroxyisobutyrate dehydrogenase n=1 Tax=Pseudarthrobacter sp. AG30 TaxID=2249742 RepID=UPI000D6E640D|nr:3-hydroxyisobutyrate dehydrogenase [Pseudarthrobacter sp. AG30]RAX14933.1 3-hydroxyisobutyrate dehydrogenase [Pseudarthrobacter sp. AG30]
MTKRIAFIGLGNMGGYMAANLAAAGYQVSGYDLATEAAEKARRNGINTTTTAEEAASHANIVFTMLPSGQHLLEAYETLLRAAPANTLFVDCSTVDVTQARQARDLALNAGHRAMDAPVSGGTVGAEAATLTFMAGGEPEDFTHIRPLLETMGRTIIHCGDPGAGQAAKICNNLILGITMIAVSEAFVLGEKLGLDHQALYDVASQSSGACWALTNNCPVPGPVPTSPANRNYQPGFMTSLMSKDLSLALNAINDTGVAAEIGPLAAKIYRQLSHGPRAHDDFSTVINTIRDQTNTAHTADKATL